MNNNKIEELQERLEELHRTQDARLACNADDLDVREEIAEAEDEIKELQDDINEKNNNGNDINVGSIGNSIEEDIKILEEMINEEKYVYKRNRRGNKEIRFEVGSNYFKALEHILSDYKRVLKENEELKNKDIIIVDKKTRKGQPVIKGTRLTILDVLLFVIEFVRDHEEEFKANYANIESNQIILALDYFVDNSIPVQKIKDKIKKNEEFIEETNDGDLIHKLDKENEVLQELLKERGKIICIKNGE